LSATKGALGWSRRAQDDDDARLGRARAIAILGGLGGDADVQREADRRIRRYLADPASLDPALADVVVLLGAELGDAARYDAYVSRLKQARTPEEQARFREALAHFRRPHLFHRTLSLLLTPLVPPDTLTRFAAELTDNVRARPTAWRYLRTHFYALERKAPRAGWLLPATERLCGDTLAQRVARFLSAHERYASLSRAFSEATERSGRCVQLRQRASRETNEWLRAHYAEARSLPRTARSR
jgi:hypothetical protein